MSKGTNYNFEVFLRKYRKPSHYTRLLFGGKAERNGLRYGTTYGTVPLR